jgi:uncharacterized protein (TIGR00255 family)
MALNSMTGFARIEGGQGELNWTLELRGVNGRGLDVRYRFPAGFEAVERLGRELSKRHFQRGQMNLTVSVTSARAATGVAVNQEALDLYIAASNRLVEAGHALTPGADGLLALRGVIETSGDEGVALDEAAEAALAADLASLCEGMTAARGAEGQALEAVLNGHLASMEKLVAEAEGLAQQQVEAIRDRFARRMAELNGEAGEGLAERVMQEAAALAVKADVREELDRLQSHIEQAHRLIGEEVAPGRKLDFLAQEFMREANTLCSKSALIALTRAGLELKAVIDQFREQTQNVE